MGRAQSWHVCLECGKGRYPNIDMRKMCGITVCIGTCPCCGNEGVTLIPWSDFRYASGDDKEWD